MAIRELTGAWRLRNVKRSNSELETDTKETKSTNIERIITKVRSVCQKW